MGATLDLLVHRPGLRIRQELRAPGRAAPAGPRRRRRSPPSGACSPTPRPSASARPSCGSGSLACPPSRPSPRPTPPAGRPRSRGSPPWAAARRRSATASPSSPRPSRTRPRTPPASSCSAREDGKATGRDRTSIAFTLDRDRPGGLYEVIAEFATRRINLSRIESRPTKTAVGHYVFFLDFEGHRAEPECADALAGVRRQVHMMLLLGLLPARLSTAGAVAAASDRRRWSAPAPQHPPARLAPARTARGHARGEARPARPARRGVRRSASPPEERGPRGRARATSADERRRPAPRSSPPPRPRRPARAPRGTRRPGSRRGRPSLRGRGPGRRSTTTGSPVRSPRRDGRAGLARSSWVSIQIRSAPAAASARQAGSYRSRSSAADGPRPSGLERPVAPTQPATAAGRGQASQRHGPARHLAGVEIGSGQVEPGQVEGAGEEDLGAGGGVAGRGRRATSQGRSRTQAPGRSPAGSPRARSAVPMPPSSRTTRPPRGQGINRAPPSRGGRGRGPPSRGRRCAPPGRRGPWARRGRRRSCRGGVATPSSQRATSSRSPWAEKPGRETTRARTGTSFPCMRTVSAPFCRLQPRVPAAWKPTRRTVVDGSGRRRSRWWRTRPPVAMPGGRDDDARTVNAVDGLRLARCCG